MTCHEYEPQLGDYVDGTLPPDARARVEAHLLHCARCQAMVTDFTTLRTAAQGLEPMAPPPDLWGTIATALEQERRGRDRGGLVRRIGGWPQLAAAAVLVLLLGGGSWVAWREVARAPRGGRNTQAAQTVETELRLAEEHYTKAIASLEDIARSDATALDGQTAAVLQANLAVVDSAIGQSREALKAEPTSELAQQSLFEALRSKVTLLQDTVALINEMRKGNQEGAARIVSGMNP